MRNEIINKNDKGQLHGYQERYRSNGNLWFKCFFYNGVEIDYEEIYYFYYTGYFYYVGNGKLEKRFHI